jgi:catechol-2,3-dioxygenase
MKFRYARHTNDLKSIVDFYTKIIGLKKLGSFENHSNYNGVFIGLPNLD